jgi:cytochrome b561
MRLRNSAERYGAVTKALHWLTFALVAAQFAVGYAMRSDDDAGERGGSHGGDDGDNGGGSPGGSHGENHGGSHGRGDGGPGSDDFASGHEGLLDVHVLLGATILVVAALRLWWRVSGSLPAWAPQLRDLERRLQAALEKCLYLLLFAIPVSGLALVLASGEDVHVFGSEWSSSVELADDDALLTAHIATHVAFFAVVGLHIGLVLKHQLVQRDGLLRRMV